MHRIGLLSSNNGHSIPSRIKPIQDLAMRGFLLISDYSMGKIFYTVIALFLLGAGFIFGLLLSYKHDVDLIERTKRTVLGYLENPKIETFKNVVYRFNKISHNGGQVGYVCGYVSRHYILTEDPEFKRFIVKTYIKPDGVANLSIPVIEGVDEMLTTQQVDILWDRFCGSKEVPVSPNL